MKDYDPIDDEFDDLDDEDAYKDAEWHHDLDPCIEEDDEEWIVDELGIMEEKGDFV